MESFSIYEERLRNYSRAAYLFAGFIQKTLNREEERELDDFIDSSEENMNLFLQLTDDSIVNEFLKWYIETDLEKKLEASKRRIHFKEKPISVPLIRIAVAASVLLLLIGTGIYWFLGHDSTDIPLVKQNTPDVQPGSLKALLKMENGVTIALGRDTAISQQVQVKNGEITYAVSNGQVNIHELFIPRKGYYRLVLPDGTKVWLNSESSIRYPSAFIAGERRVEVTGETFFEVAADITRPFIVQVNDIDVTALGTAFNINGYQNEKSLQMTLIEGLIKVSKTGKEERLKPGQQLRITGETWTIAKQVNATTTTAWVDNEFRFKNNSIQEIMRMLQRWYDVQVVYESEIGFHFNGTIDRSMPLSKVLMLLEKTGHVHFRLAGNQVIITE